MQPACRIIIFIENCFVFKAWQVVFKIPFGKRPTGYNSIMDFWAASGSYHDTSAAARNDFSTSSEIFKSSILDDWVLQSISAVSNYTFINVFFKCIIACILFYNMLSTEIPYLLVKLSWRIWLYHRGNQNPYIEEEQATLWPKEKVQIRDKQRFTKHTHKTKDRVTRTPLKIVVELRFTGRVSSSCSTSGTCRANIVTNPVISHERGKDREVFIYCLERWDVINMIG